MEPPMRVLHLIDQAGGQTCSTTLALLAQALGRLTDTQQHVLLLGNAALQRAAEQVGVVGARRLAAPWGRAVCAWPALRHHLRRGRLTHLGSGRVDLVHCWSVDALTLALLVWRKVPRLLTLATCPSRQVAHWLSVLCRDPSGSTALLPTSASLRRTMLSRGVPEQAAHVLRPGLDLGMVDHQSRLGLRQRWGIESDKVKVVALLADPPHTVDTLVAARTLMLAADAYPPGRQPIRLLVGPDHGRRHSAARLLRGLGRGHWIFCDARLAQPWRVLPGCDVALSFGPQAGGMSLLWAMAASTPIVSEATYAVSEVVEDRHTALLAKPGRPELLAHRIKQVIDDDQLAWRLKDAARSEVYSIFSRAHYCRCIRAVYEQMVAQRPIEVPPPELTGGLRFMGKA